MFTYPSRFTPFNSIYIKLCNSLDTFFNTLKVFHFRMKGIKIGKNCRIYQGVRLSGNIEIGDDVRIGSYSYISTYSDGQVIIKNDVLIGSCSYIGSGHASVSIGNHCIFAAGVFISDSTHDISDVNVLTKHAPVISKPTEIQDNVWLGFEAQVLAGVTVGQGSVIGAKSLVTKNIHPFSVAVGIPARFVRDRLAQPLAGEVVG